VILILYIYVVDQVTVKNSVNVSAPLRAILNARRYKKEFEFLIFGQTWCEFWCQDIWFRH